MVGVAPFVLCRRDPRHSLPGAAASRQPIIFCLSSAYMLYARVAYSGMAAFVGLAVLAAGTPILLFKTRRGDAARPAPDATAFK
jgi:hypothetical protein